MLVVCEICRLRSVHSLDLRDTAGQERFNSITSAYYRGAKGIVLVYDITKLESFDDLPKWMKMIDKVSSHTAAPPVCVHTIQTFLLKIVFKLMMYLHLKSDQSDMISDSIECFNRWCRLKIKFQHSDVDLGLFKLVYRSSAPHNGCVYVNNVAQHQ